jgi:RNA polymerase sigma-70 factor (ECF subfamily)
MQEGSLRAVDAARAGSALLPGSGVPTVFTGALPLRSDSQQSAVIDREGIAQDVALAARGDVSAFERVYHAHLARVHNLVRRMSGGRDTDELTQDVFVRVWQKLGSFRGDSAFSTWLHRLAVNVIIERFRADTARRKRLASGEVLLEMLPGPSRSYDLSMDFETALETLPDGAREIFVLHDVEGHKHREIAALLGISAGTSKAQLHRARMMLRRHLRPGQPAQGTSDDD